MQLDNVVVQFEADLSSAGRNRAARCAEERRTVGYIPDYRNYTVRETRARVVSGCEPETGSIAAGYPFNDIARTGIRTYIRKNSYYRSARRARERSAAGRRREDRACAVERAIAHLRGTR